MAPGTPEDSRQTNGDGTSGGTVSVRVRVWVSPSDGVWARSVRGSTRKVDDSD